ncbi:hypothetical protein PQX77_000824 [Marasmius sp. AFHP31]|nr:hypothetical protein PQX77_000824 [Marasmius sp. AFHP31]
MQASASLDFTIHHVFLPIKLPQTDDWTQQSELELCLEVLEAARTYQNHHVQTQEHSQWDSIVRMLEQVCVLHGNGPFSKETLCNTLNDMDHGDVTAIFVRAQNAGFIVRKHADRCVFDSFEAALPIEVVTNTIGKPTVAFPSTSIAVPSAISSDPSFLSEISNFLARMNVDVFSDAESKITAMPQWKTVEIKDSTHPKYISELLTGMLRGLGRPEEGRRIQKRVGDEVLMEKNNTSNVHPWRRSPMWLVIRVALQTSLNTDAEYKQFMVFFMARILSKALESSHSYDSDLLSVMQTKLATKYYKLSRHPSIHIPRGFDDSDNPDPNPNPFYEYVSRTISLSHALLNERFQAVQERHSDGPGSNAGWEPATLRIYDDTALTLPRSGPYIEDVLNLSRRSIAASHDVFRPNERLRRTLLSQFEAKGTLDEDGEGNLVDFERAVEEGLDMWVDERQFSSPIKSFLVLSRWITDYEKKARRLYAGKPANMSIMYLTLLDLWIGLDKICTSESKCPLLLDYSPEIHEALFEPLLLQRGISIARLKSHIQYLRTRHSRATTAGNPSIFSQKITPSSFVVRYFNLPSSTSYRHLKRNIEDQAHRDRQAKLSELVQLNQLYTTLTARSNSLSESYETRSVYNPQTETFEDTRVHSSRCEKCRLKKQASELRIEVFEWPLSRDPSEAEGSVVELDPPAALRVWRDATYFLLRQVFSVPSKESESESESATSKPKCMIRSYRGTGDYVQAENLGELTLGSKSTSAYQRKDSTIHIPCHDEGTVCVENSLRYRLFDEGTGEWVSPPSSYSSSSCLRETCAYQLPPGKYRDSELQRTVGWVDHTSNEVIAKQGRCQLGINLHEYLAFGCLRAGSSLQWMNIVRELLAKILTFSDEAVEMLVRQAHSQMGPLDGEGGWAWHMELQDPEFHSVLLRELGDLLESICGNWAEVGAMRVIIMLASVLLERPPRSNGAVVREAGVGLLRSARTVMAGWMVQLDKRLKGVNYEKRTQEFQRRLWEVAGTCRMTFHHFLDPAHRDNGNYLELLEEDKSVWFRASIVLHDNQPTQPSTLSPMLSALYSFDQRFARLSSDVLREDPSGLSRAVKEVWPFFDGDGGWSSLPAPNNCWMTCWSGNAERNNYQRVHFNLTTGQLLIDGKPLNRLPREFTDHLMYSRIFGKAILDVVPPDPSDTDAQFATKDKIAEQYRVTFMLRGEHLIIRAKHDDGSRYELIPHEQFQGDLPSDMVTDHVHWLDLEEREVELRSVGDPWQRCSSHWSIRLDDRRCMRVNSAAGFVTYLVDMHRSTGKMIASRLGPLENAENLIVTASTDKPLSINLPRYRLSFSVGATGQLECQTYPGMVVADDQSAGIFIGLRNQLVLKNGSGEKRSIIIPVGAVEYVDRGFHNWHTAVTIHPEASRRVRFYRYDIDPVLGCLTGAFDLHSRLYLTYLKAVTSHCLSNPLTGRTGTEEALLELRSASHRSFQQLDERSLGLLEALNALTPVRTSPMRGVQNVKWEALPPSAQHLGFQPACQEILEFARKLEVFSTRRLVEERLTTPDAQAYLQQRASIRLSLYYSAELRDSSSPEPRSYRSRAEPSGAEMEQRICKNSRIITSPQSSYSIEREPRDQQLSKLVEQWSDPCGATRIKDTTLTYTREWVETPLPHSFLSLYDLLRRTRPSVYQMLFTLGPMTYGQHRDAVQRLLKPLVAFGRTNCFASTTFNPPAALSHSDLILEGILPTRSYLSRIAREEASERLVDYAAKVPRYLGTRSFNRERRQREARYPHKQQEEANVIADIAVRHWPDRPMMERHQVFEIIQVNKFFDAIERRDQRWLENQAFVLLVQTKLGEIPGVQALPPPATYSRPSCVPQPPMSFSHISLKELFQRGSPLISSDDLPSLIPARLDLYPSEHRHEVAAEQSLHDVRELTREVSMRGGGVHTHYVQGLHESTDAYHEELRQDTFVNGPAQFLRQAHAPDMEVSINFEGDLVAYKEACQVYLDRFSKTLLSILKPQNTVEEPLVACGVWPSTTRSSLLQALASVPKKSIPLIWKKAIRHLGRSILLFQRSLRLITLWRLHKFEDFWKEMNAGNSGLCVGDDGLLMQVDGDFFIRDMQHSVADKMVQPTSGSNTVHQLNMGEGKSSVIVPLIAARLADGDKLVRIVVLRSLSSQMFSLLVQRLSGFTNRQVLYMPFSRDVNISGHRIQTIRRLFEDAIRNQSIIVAQPEHILSFQLMTVDHILRRPPPGTSTLVTPTLSETEDLVQTQLLLDRCSRDVQDECDELMRTEFELTYTKGLQQLLEDNPFRWRTLQSVLHLLQVSITDHVRSTGSLTVCDGLDVNVRDDSPGFPRLHISNPKAAQILVTALVGRVMDGHIPECFAPSHYPVPLRQSAKAFISGLAVAPSTEEELRVRAGASWKTLLLLRGLFGGGLLAHVLMKRWRVDYGLDPSRTLLAVPYRAKDVPSLRAEFGHPDVAILLTCLSYLQGGLSRAEVISAFEELLKLDDPSQEFDKWVGSSTSLPTELWSIRGINLKDPSQTDDQLYIHFRYNHAMIDFYLSALVFPRSAKEFPHKLTTTGWDLARRKVHVTTGFSGTNDNQLLLPTSMQQDASPDRLSTNARMLAVLLKPENGRYVCPSSRIPSAVDIVNSITGPYDGSVRVMLDVGALVVEVTNLELMQYWLSRRPDVKAGLYFDEDNVLQVLTHDGLTEPLTMSPFYQQLDECLVYLDDVHTRGTDLKLPTHWKACVTLGPKVTKDRLVQGCMRMRKLGHGQSVMFIAPHNIDRAIRELANKLTSGSVHTIDVLRWSIHETCAEILHRVPLWAEQGIDFANRNRAWKELSTSTQPLSQRVCDSIRSTWLQPEARALESMYGQSEDGLTELLTRLRSHPDICSRWEDLGVRSTSTSRIDEEQEREVSNEVEREPERELPPEVEPARHSIHPDVESFVETGILRYCSSAFSSAFVPVRDGAGTYTEQRWIPTPPQECQIMASKDFLETINGGGTTGDYLRPVNWVVTNRFNTFLVILSPYEIDHLLPKIRQSEHVRLHIYTPRTAVSTKPTDDLEMYTMCPRHLHRIQPSETAIDQLNLCAGQLYFSSYRDYRRVWEALRIGDHDSGEVERSRLMYLKTLVGCRRRGLAFESTHLGKMLKALPIPEQAFELG